MAEMTRDLAAFMVAEGIGTALGTDVFLERRPPTPDQCLTVTDTGGFPPIKGLEDLRRTVQVMVRAKGAGTAKALGWTVYRLFSDPPSGCNISVDGSMYLVTPAQPPVPLGEDDDGRSLYSVNLVALATPDA